MAKSIGVTDIPCISEKDDQLDIVKYVDGLQKFIKKCPTPMSIAIQGDWGTGKTSTINMLQKKLEKEDKIKCVYFNTWQYSQFSMADDLYLSFVNTLVKKCCDHQEKAKNIMASIQKLGTSLINNVVKENVGIDIGDYFKKQEEKMESVENLKEEFRKMIDSEVGSDGRIVIFIDDLDRLTPGIAVELLEVIKIFMDVEKCIFVLAIDYDVVVNGVRSKYGENVSQEKCRSFFDKIIQLPFRLPVEHYSLNKLVRQTVEGSVMEQDIDALADYIGSELVYNPRAYKRLANSFFLIQSVNEAFNKKTDIKLDNALTFASLCIQMCEPKFYTVLVYMDVNDLFQNMDSEENLAQYLTDMGLDDYTEDDIKDITRALKKLDLFMNRISENHNGRDEINKQLTDVLQMTSITSVAASEEKTERKKAIKINKVIINDNVNMIDTPTNAIVKVYKEFLGENKDLIDSYIEWERRMLTKEDRHDAFFRNRQELCEDNSGNTVYIGLSSSTSDKMIFVGKLCEFMKSKDKKAHVIWKYNDEVVYDSEQR